jgi:hypothetical protein
MEFAPAKSVLLHFSRARTACELLVRLGDAEIRPVPSARFLGIWLDVKLNWKAHIQRVKAKPKTQVLAFSKLAASAWGTTVPRARQIYAVVIRSVLAYGLTA